LNLVQRETERTQQDAQVLARENARRAAAALPALKALTDLKPEDQPDVVLAEAARITARYALGVQGPATTTAANGIGARSAPAQH